MATEQRIEVKTSTVGCDGLPSPKRGLGSAPAGGGGALGHPTVYLKIGDAGAVTCPYCSRHYVRGKDAPAEAGH
ncbi:MAG: zinc-finger domain-containing protein [Proteobacteria bacterium]|nr:zinc-finger domain-containing protein [Pseudomonadota bacterium]